MRRGGGGSRLCRRVKSFTTLRGKGLPKGKGEAGDLYVEIKIVVPEELSAEERELFEKLAATSEFRAREEGSADRRESARAREER